MPYPINVNVQTRMLFRWLVVLIGTAISTSAFSQDTQWTWVRVAPMAHEWEILEGKADVDIDQNRLVAVLYDKENVKFKRFSITGKVSGNRITSVETRLHSDVGQIQMKGRFSKVDCDAENNECSYLVTLSDGWVYVGLIRPRGLKVPGSN